MPPNFDKAALQSVADVAKVIGFQEPPSWTRLEPQSTSGDPEVALEARVHDPLWLLARQWQFGEFEGEDAGSPISVRVEATSARVTRWMPGDGAGAPAGETGLPLARTDLLEPLVEAEPPVPPATGAALQSAAETGMRLVRDLSTAGLATYRPVFTAAYPLAATASDDPAARRLARLVAGRGPDGHAVARALIAAAPGTLPAELAVDAADRDAVHDVAHAWLEWYTAEQGAAAGGAADCWVPERLEYRFRVAAPGPGEERVLVAPEFGGGRVDWWAFNALGANASLGAGADEAPRHLTQTLLPTPVRFAGMPAERFWEFEDARVNLGRLDTAPHDLARLLLVEFATVYGNDWILVPLDVEQGTLTTVDSVVYRTTFGDRFLVRATEAMLQDGNRWRMFRMSTGDGGSLPALFVPPASPGYLEGSLTEEVLLLRDEMANLAWAVEHLIEGVSGRAVDRSREPLPVLAPRPNPTIHPEAELDYLIQTNVPGRWIPLVPVRTAGRAFRLVRGALTAVDAAGVRREISPRSRLLGDRGDERFWVHEEEVPRAGARLLRQPASARLTDGRMLRWMGRRLRVGRGEGTSGLAFDAALPRRPGSGS